MVLLTSDSRINTAWAVVSTKTFADHCRSFGPEIDDFYRTLSISAQSVGRFARFCHDCLHICGWAMTISVKLGGDC